ncbi:MAG: hypothetical protein VKO01_12155 [Cyanobacteriota bacterium]|nr:hypothetical protein [Cyanobacteriota bacterium]
MATALVRVFSDRQRSPRPWVTALVALTVLGLTGCGSSKVSQCNKLAAVVNQTQDFMKEFETEIQAFSESAAQVKNLDDIKAAASQYTTAVDKVVANLDGLAQNLQTTSLKDSELSQFRDSYVEVVSGFKSALEEARQAMDLVVTVQSETDLPAKIEESQQQTVKAVTAIENLSQKEAQLITDVNNYCGAVPPKTDQAPDQPSETPPPQTPNQ